MLQAGSSYGLGDAVMDQVRLQDQLRDGTGTNCSNPDGSGTCDGTGPYGSVAAPVAVALEAAATAG